MTGNTEVSGSRVEMSVLPTTHQIPERRMSRTFLKQVRIAAT
jgi:hypothetical protein